MLFVLLNQQRQQKNYLHNCRGFAYQGIARPRVAQAGFSSWSQYCASGRIEYKKSRAEDYIRCSELRPKLSGIPGHDWSVEQCLELCKCETDNDAKRVAKKAIAQAGLRVGRKLGVPAADADKWICQHMLRVGRKLGVPAAGRSPSEMQRVRIAPNRRAEIQVGRLPR